MEKLKDLLQFLDGIIKAILRWIAEQIQGS